MMAIPEVNPLMGPVLELLADGKIHTRAEIIEEIAAKFNLTDAELKAKMSNTNSSKLGNHIDWVRAYFTQHKLIETPTKSQVHITARGLKIYRNHLAELSISFLNQIAHRYRDDEAQ
jgi:restriction system protein